MQEVTLAGVSLRKPAVIMLRQSIVHGSKPVRCLQAQ